MFSKDIEKHQKSKTCENLRKRRVNETNQDRQAKANEIKFFVYEQELEKVEEFKYLGRTLSHMDDDTKCIEQNIKKTRQQWNAIAKILKREGANSTTMGKFYLAVVQAVLLYGAGTWVVDKQNLRKLQSMHHRAVRYMTGEHIRKVGDTWEYPSHEKLLQKCGLFSIETYIERRRGTLMAYLEKNKSKLLEQAHAV